MKRVLPIVAVSALLIISLAPSDYQIAGRQTTLASAPTTASVAYDGHGLLAPTPAPVSAGAALTNVTTIDPRQQLVCNQSHSERSNFGVGRAAPGQTDSD